MWILRHWRYSSARDYQSLFSEKGVGLYSGQAVIKEFITGIVVDLASLRQATVSTFESKPKGVYTKLFTGYTTVFQERTVIYTTFERSFGWFCVDAK